MIGLEYVFFFIKIVLVHVQLWQKYYAPKFNPTGLQAHDLHIMKSSFHIPETPSS